MKHSYKGWDEPYAAGEEGNVYLQEILAGALAGGGSRQLEEFQIDAAT